MLVNRNIYVSGCGMIALFLVVAMHCSCRSIRTMHGGEAVYSYGLSLSWPTVSRLEVRGKLRLKGFHYFPQGVIIEKGGVLELTSGCTLVLGGSTGWIYNDGLLFCNGKGDDRVRIANCGGIKGSGEIRGEGLTIELMGMSLSTRPPYEVVGANEEGDLYDKIPYGDPMFVDHMDAAWYFIDQRCVSLFSARLCVFQSSFLVGMGYTFGCIKAQSVELASSSISYGFEERVHAQNARSWLIEDMVSAYRLKSESLDEHVVAVIMSDMIRLTDCVISGADIPIFVGCVDVVEKCRFEP